MLYLYDRALVNKFAQVMPGKVIYSPVDTFYERYLLANDNSGLVLPALSVWRTGINIDKGTLPSHLRIGNVKFPNPQTFTAEQFYSCRAEMSYQLDAWTANDTDRDDLLKELLYFLTLYPYVAIEYRGHKFTFPITLGDATDSSDISSFENTGDIYRLTIPLQIPDARILYYDDIKLLKFIDLTFLADDQPV